VVLTTTTVEHSPDPYTGDEVRVQKEDSGREGEMERREGKGKTNGREFISIC